MKKWFLVLLIALPLFTPVYSQTGHEEPNHHKEWVKIIALLNLSPAQKKSIDGIMQGVHHDIMPLKTQEKEKRIELNKILESPNPDRNAAKEKLQEILSLHAERHLRFADAYFDTLAILTPKQKTIFTKLAARRMFGSHGER